MTSFCHHPILFYTLNLSLQDAVNSIHWVTLSVDILVSNICTVINFLLEEVYQLSEFDFGKGFEILKLLNFIIQSQFEDNERSMEEEIGSQSGQ